MLNSVTDNLTMKNSHHLAGETYIKPLRGTFSVPVKRAILVRMQLVKAAISDVMSADASSAP